MEAHFLRIKQSSGTGAERAPAEPIERRLGYKKRLHLVGERLVEFDEHGLPRREIGLGSPKRLHLVREWLVEFDEDGQPRREIGLGSGGQVVIAAPNSVDDGFWANANITYEDMTGEPVSNELFEALWVQGEQYRGSVAQEQTGSQTLPRLLPSWLLKIAIAVPSLCMLALGMFVASEGYGFAAGLWAAACIIGMVLVVYSVFRYRLPLVLLVVLGGIALGFVSCSATFRWGGG